MPDLLTILTATSPFWWQGLKRAAQVLVDAAQDVLDEEAKKQTRKALKPVLDRLEQPEAEKAFHEAFIDAGRAYLGRYGGGERELPKAVLNLLERAVEKELEDANSDVLQSYLLTDRPQRAPLDRWVQRQLGGESLVTGQARVFTQEEVTAELDIFFRDLRTAFLGHRFFSKEMFQVANLDLLTQIRDALIEKRADLAQMEKEYLAYVSRQNEWIELRGIAPRVQGREVKMRMADLFVPLQATPVRDVRQEMEAEVLSRVQEALDSGTPPEEALDVLEQELGREVPDVPRALATRDSEAFIALLRELLEREAVGRGPAKGDVLGMADVLAEKRVVILGDPGAGKSTLLRYAAYAVSNHDASLVGAEPQGHVPILVRIADFARIRQTGPELTLVEYTRDRVEKDFAPLFSERLAAGQCLILLDGLDEVADHHHRGQVVREIEKFIARYPHNRYVVTSRLVGYEQTRLNTDFRHFTMAPLSRKIISHFVTRWYEAIERESGADLKDGEVERRALELVNAIDGHPGIQRLATNPLLLTIIALVNWRGRKLPNRRVELYQIACETLIENWPLHRLGVKLDAEQIMTILAPVAYQIFASQTGHHITERILIPRLTVAMREEQGGTENEARRAAEAILDTVSSQCGIFLQRGYDESGNPVYGFLHLTFLEYLAACHMAQRWVEGQLPLGEFCHTARWKEVVLLMVARVGVYGRPLATRILGEIVDLNSPYEPSLHRDLLLACACLADDLRVKPEASRSIVRRAAEVAVHTQIDTLRHSILKSLQSMRGTIHEFDAQVAIARWLADYHSDVLCTAALGLSMGGTPTEDTVSSLRLVLSDHHPKVRTAALMALAELAAGDHDTVAAVTLCLTDPEPQVRQAAAGALAQLAPASHDTVAALVLRLSDDDSAVRETAADALAELGPGYGRTIFSTLDEMAAENPEIRRQASRSLAPMADYAGKTRHWSLESIGVEYGAGPIPARPAAYGPQAASYLRSLLRHDHPRMRAAAADCLGGCTREDPETISAITACLSDEYALVRQAAILSLRRLRIHADATIAALTHCLGDEESTIREDAASALGQLSPATPATLSALRRRLSDESSLVRESAARALGILGVGDQDTISSLTQCLTDKDPSARAGAAVALAKVGASYESTVAALEGLLHDTTETRDGLTICEQVYVYIVYLLDQRAAEPRSLVD